MWTPWTTPSGFSPPAAPCSNRGHAKKAVAVATAFFRLYGLSGAYQYMPPFRTSKFSPFREANRKVNFCRFFKGSRRFSAVQKLSVHPPIVYTVLRKFTTFWRKLWRKFRPPYQRLDTTCSNAFSTNSCKFTAFWRKLWRKFCAHIRGWPQPVQTPFRRTHSCCGCRHPR